jgi:hypothetical protein
VLHRVSKSKDTTTDVYQLLVPLRPWHTVGLNYLIRFHVSNGFDNVLIAVDYVMTRMAHFLPCIESVAVEETTSTFLRESSDCTDYLESSLVIVTQSSSVAYGKRFGDASELVSTCFPLDTWRRIE